MGAVLEQQPDVAEVEEREAGRVEFGDEGETEHVLVEGDRPVEVRGTLADLVQAAEAERLGHRRTIRFHRACSPGW